MRKKLITKAQFGWLSSLFKSEPDKKEQQTSNIKRVKLNDSPTSKDSENMENAWAKEMKKREVQQNNGKDYYIPYVGDKTIFIKGYGEVPTNVLDSIQVNAKRAGITLIDALGLVAQETRFGRTPLFSLKTEKDHFLKKHKYPMPKDRAKYVERVAFNGNFFKNFGGIYPQYLINNHEWYRRGYKDSAKYKYLNDIQSPLEHGFVQFKAGIYNTGDKNHTKDVRKAGNQIYSQPSVYDYYNNK